MALLVLVPLLLILLGLRVEPGSTPDTVRAKIFGAEPGMFFLYEERGEVRRHYPPAEIPKDRLVQVVSVWVLGFVGSWGILLALFLTAGLLPRTLAKGYAELVLSKPVPRWSVYLGRYAGAVSLFAGACLVVALAVEGILAGVVSVPCRYIHSPVSTLYLSDLEATIKLVVAFLRRAGELL